ncbi:MAG: extracellular solute-binding protein [Clostridia bacterium]|nr:extracellular solute-binding protein [Clostridia bacterium]
MKKWLALLLAVVMVLSMAPMAMAEEKPVLTWLMTGDNNVNEETEVLTELEKRLNMDINIIYINGRDFETKLNTMIAGGELPDIFAGKGQTVVDLAEGGKLLDLAPYLPEYGKDILAAYPEGYLNTLPLNKDGKIYGLTVQSPPYTSNFHLRKDWLDNLGLAVPTTLDELYNVLKAFTFDDPDQNGVKDTWGFASHLNTAKEWDHVFAAYGIPYDQTITLEDGTVTRFVKHPNYLDAVKYLNKLYQDGIMYPDFVNLDWVASAEMLWNGEVGIFDFQAAGPANNWFPGRYTFPIPEKVEDLFVLANFAHVETGEPTGGVKQYSSTTNYEAVVSADCKYPEAAVELINYLGYSEEGQELTYMGIEDVMFKWIDKPNGKYERIGAYADDTVHRAAGAYVYNTAGGWTRENAQTRTLNAFTQNAMAYEDSIATDYTFIADNLETWTEFGTTLKAIEQEMLATLIISTGDLEAQYAEYIARLEDEGLADYEEEATAYINSK